MHQSDGRREGPADRRGFRFCTKTMRLAIRRLHMVGWALGLLFLVWSNPVLAQTLTVRSGEHATYTRLVMRLPDGIDWRLQQDGPVAELFIEGDNVSFDMSGVFARIPRVRLSDLAQDGPGKPLRLNLACNCPVTGFLERDDYLVLDIGDPVSDVPVRFGLSEPETAKPPVLPPQSGAAAMVLPLIGNDPAAQLLMRDHGAHMIVGPVTGEATGKAADDPGASDHVEELAQDRNDGLSRSERAIQEQIARAATQGLVDVDADALRSIEAQSEVPDTVDAAQLRSNIKATTSVDRDMSLAAGPLSVNGHGGYCMDPDRIDITTWGDDRPFGHQIGAFRTRMAGEFDDLSPGDLRGLAKTYLYFGFGAEARQLLREADERKADIRILDAFARLLDEGQLKKPHPFDDQKHCNSAVAMWSVYANPVSPRDEINSDAIVRAFAELPPHLRDHVGPGLMRRFVNAGDADTAEILKRIINRAAPRDDASMQMAEAELARLNGKETQADELVKDVAHGGSGESPNALITLVDRHFESRKPVPSDTVQLISSYVLEMRRTEAGEDLARAHALALGLAGDFHAAFDVAGQLDRAVSEQTIGQLLDVLTENADDVTFLELSFDTAVTTPNVFPGETKLKVAQRLLDTGFPETAMALADQPVSGRLHEEQAVIRAEASLAMGLPRRALLELVGRSGPDIDVLRAEALRMSGLHAEAAEIFASMEAREDAARSEWLAGLPVEDSATGQTEFSDRQMASQRLANLPPATGENTLSGARALLNQAEALRQDVSLLNSGLPPEGQ